MEEIEKKWKARLERERKARKEAERLLEEKSLELYDLNLSLREKIEREITKSKKRENFLAEQSKLASMGEMIGNIAHQWRQPLSAITSSASSAKLQMQLGLIEDDEQMDIYSKIIEKAEFLSSTIDDFRNFFKSNKEKVQFNIPGVIKNVKSIVSATYQNYHINIIDDVNYDEPVLSIGLPGELSQVILNLFNNARDILVEKDIKEKIVKLNTKKSFGKITIEVCDNGGGVPEDIIGKIFEPYFTTKHQAQGTGIGLYMSREIIRNHFNGQIHVKNKEFEVGGKKYKGACFCVEINIE